MENEPTINQSPEVSPHPQTSENNPKPSNSPPEENSTSDQQQNSIDTSEKQVQANPKTSAEVNLPLQPSGQQQSNFNLRDLELPRFFKKTPSQEKSDQSKTTNDKTINIEAEDKEENPFARMPSERLTDRLKEIERDINIYKREVENLTIEIEYTVKAIGTTIGDIEIIRLKAKKKTHEDEREVSRQKLDDLNIQYQNINDVLKERKNKAKTSSQDETKTSEQEAISAQSLFIDGQPIENTVFYVATFFPELSISDFKDVVSKFLEKSPPIKIQEEVVVTNRQNKTPKKEVEKKAVEVWKESFQKPEQFLKKCYLKARRKDSTFVIDFCSSDLRKNLRQYFEDEEIFYLEEQLSVVQELLFVKSDKVAEKAITILAEASIYSPNYDFEWLLKITLAAELNQSQILFDRVSRLIYEIQITLKSSQSKPIVKSFLDTLLANKRDYVFKIILYLMYRHLCSPLRINRFDSLQQLLEWLQECLNQGIEDAYEVLFDLLRQPNTSTYIYDLLGIIKTWLPEPELSADKYSPSNQAALLLVIQYSAESLYLDQTKYPLFSSLINESDFDGKLEILVSCLFYRSEDKTLAIKFIFISDDEIETIDPLEILATFIEKWFIILCGLDIKQCEPEAEKIANSLLRQVIKMTDASERRNLNRYWAEFAAFLLQEAASKAASGSSRQDKEVLMKERTMIQELRSRFQNLQEQEIKE